MHHHIRIKDLFTGKNQYAYLKLSTMKKIQLAWAYMGIKIFGLCEYSTYHSPVIMIDLK